MKGMKEKIHKGICFLLCFLMLVSFFNIPVRAEESDVRVGWYEDSYHITGKNGEKSGYGYEYEQAVAAYTGWNYKYVKAGWSDLLEMLENDEIDLMAAVSYTDERAQSMLFSDLPMGKEIYYLYADLVNTNISISDLSSLNGKKVAVLKESVQTTQFYEWEEKNNVHLQSVFVESLDEAMEKAKKHEIDCVISTETPIWVNYGMSAIFTTGESGIYYAINKNRPDLKEKIDQAMRSMEYDKPFYADDLYKKYLSSSSTPVLSQEEKDWIKEHGNICIGYLKNDKGFSYFDNDSSQLEGVITDYIVAASNCLQNQKISFDVIGFDSTEEQLKAIKENKIDMIFNFSQNPYVAQQNDLILSNTVASVPLTVVTSKSTFNEDQENTVAIEKGNLLLKWSISYNYPSWKIVEYKNHEKIEKAVRRKEADCFVVNSNMVNSYDDDYQLHCVSLTKSADASFAVSRDNTILMSILNKTLKTISTSMLNGALSMYTSSSKKATLKDFIKDNAIFVVIVLLVILLLVLFLLRKSKNAERKVQQAVNHSMDLNKELQSNKQQLEEALIQAKEANLSKTAFLNHMSHDIRTPMNAIIGFTNIAKKQDVNQNVLNCLNKIGDSSELLLTLINDVLDISKIESGHASLNLMPVDITQITDVVIDITNGLLSNRHLDFYVERTQPEHPYVYADIIRIREVLVNILSNAVKFTNDGGSVKFISSSKLENQQLKVRYVISDTGIGMSKEFQKHIFDEFAQEQSDARTQYEGTGLGMSIAKRYVDMMNGTITLQSEKNQGTTFIVEIPLTLSEKEDLLNHDFSSTGYDLSKVHILLAEDNDLNAEIAIVQLEEVGMKVTRVSNGKEAVEVFKNHPQGTFDIILMDIMMPEMNGYEATKEIRKIAGKTIPIVAMTANAFAEDVQASIDAGMNDHLSKPIKIDDVIKTIVRNLISKA